MRHFAISAPPATWADEPVDEARVQAARALRDRFPTASLRPVQLRRAHQLDATADRSGATRVWLACECLQVTGSFKVRGALCALQRALSDGHRHVVAASAGNHGAGVAHAARTLGLRATIVAPAAAPQVKLAKMIGDSVEVIRAQGGYDDAERVARDLAKRSGIPFVSPYDDDDVLTGNGASLAFELVASLGRIPQCVLTPIGGGGLATGLALGLEACSRGDGVKRVWTVQSEACPAFALSVVTGKVVEQLEPQGPTLAEGLEGGISRRAAARVAARVAGVSVVSEASIARAMAGLWGSFGLRVEGSAAAAAVPAFEGLPAGCCGGDVVVLLTGGNVDEQVMRAVVGNTGGC